MEVTSNFDFTLIGKLGNGYYVRRLGDKLIVQRVPNRKGHIKTEAEKENQRKFGELYAGKH